MINTPRNANKPKTKKAKAKKPARKAIKEIKPQTTTMELQPQGQSAEITQKIDGRRGGGMKKGQVTAKVAATVKMVAEHGLDVKSAMRLAGYPENIPEKTLSYMKSKVAKHCLTAPGMVKLAHSAVRDALAGRGVETLKQEIDPKTGKMKEIKEITALPTATNRLAAAQMIYDRIEPIKGQQGNQAPQFTQVNINLYSNPADRFVTETATEKNVIDINSSNTKA